MLSIAIEIAAVASPLQLIDCISVTPVISGFIGVVVTIGAAVTAVQPVAVSVTLKV